MMTSPVQTESMTFRSSIARGLARQFALLAILSVTLASGTFAQALRVARVIDGDTFELSDGRRVRLIGIDTPEVHASAKLARDAEAAGLDREAVQRLGRASSDFARALVSDRAIELEYDPANIATGHLDRYRRTLAYVWALNAHGERVYMVNRRMITDGYANAYTRFPFVHAVEFLDLERKARTERRGLWAGDSMSDLSPYAPPMIRPLTPASVVASVRSEVFHDQTCRHAANLTDETRLVFSSHEEATAKGYRACRVCKPDAALQGR